MPGTRIPVIEESRLFTDPPDYALLLSLAHCRRTDAEAAGKGIPGRFHHPPARTTGGEELITLSLEER